MGRGGRDHYRYLKLYDILNIEGERKLTVLLSAEKTAFFIMLFLTNYSISCMIP